MNSSTLAIANYIFIMSVNKTMHIKKPSNFIDEMYTAMLLQQQPYTLCIPLLKINF